MDHGDHYSVADGMLQHMTAELELVGDTLVQLPGPPPLMSAQPPWGGLSPPNNWCKICYQESEGKPSSRWIGSIFPQGARQTWKIKQKFHAHHHIYCKGKVR